MNKDCTKCNINKPLEDFPPDKRVSDGRQACCRECRRKDQEARYKDDPEHQKKINAKSRRKHRKIRNERQKEYYQENREARLEYLRQWRATDRGREIQLSHNRKRRARKLEINENFTPKDVETALARASYKCENCGISNDEHIKLHGQRLHMDHTKPLILGNPLTLDNCTVLCRSCNSSKPKK